MKKKKLFLTETENLIMKYIWAAEEPVVVTEIIAHLAESYDKKLTAQTINTHLQRLGAKGFVAPAGKKSAAIRYTDLVSEEEYTKRQLDQCRDMHFGGSAYQLIVSLLHNQEISDEEKGKLLDCIMGLTAGNKKTSV